MAERVSPPQELLPAETGKRRNARIPPNYHRRKNGFERGKVWLTWLAVVAGLGWIGMTLTTRGGSQAFSRGPVAKAHALWETNCQACHVNFSPINGAAAGITSAAWHEGVSAKCQSCHPVAAHHANSLFDRKHDLAEAACAACHREHQGRNHDLTRMDDANCTACHADLAAHLKANVPSDFPPPQTPITGAITAFDETTHAKFRSLASDPGKIKFPHGVHMQLGIHSGNSGDKSREPWTEKSFRNPDDAKNYQFQQGLVQLECASCHELGREKNPGEQAATSTFTSTALPNPGAYYQPVNYERHCAACHHLEIYAENPQPNAKPAERQEPSFATLALPHRATAAQLQAAVQGFFVEQTLREPAVREYLNRPLEFPGPEPLEQSVLGETVNAKLAAKLANAATLTRHACAFCHQELTAADTDTLADDAAIAASTRQRQAARILIPDNGELPAAAPANSPNSPATQLPSVFPNVGKSQIPIVWFQHAKFNHAAHRGVTCAECHARAYPDHPEASQSSADVLIAGVESCVQCHLPSAESDFAGTSGADTAGAGTDCVECHWYHGGAGPRRGLNPHFQLPVGRERTIDQFLRGPAPR